MDKKIIAGMVVAALVTSVVPSNHGQASAAVKGKGYSISKKAGTYRGTIKVKLKAKKGYKVYYSTSSKLKVKKVLKSKKSKTFTIKKTSTLKILAVKSSKKVTKKYLKSSAAKKKIKKYKYKISEEQVSSKETAAVTSELAATEAAATSAPTVTEVAATSAPTATEVAATSEPTATEAAVTSEPAATAVVATISPKETEAAVLVPPSDAPTAAPIETVAPIKYDENTVGIKLSQNQSTISENGSDKVAVSEEDGVTTVAITEGGTFSLEGGSKSAPLTNFIVDIAKDIEEPVNLILQDLYVDNSEFSGDDAIITAKKGTKNVNISLAGTTELTGYGAYSKSPASAIICAKDSDAKLVVMAASEDASLIIKDSMPADVDYGENDPTDGISSKGELVIQSGNLEINANGDCLKGTGYVDDSGNVVGGVSICGGKTNLEAGNCGIKSKNGNIKINSGKINVLKCGGDGIQAKNYDVNISGGTLNIDNCYGDGIQGEWVYISGNETDIDIKTYFEDAGTNYYNSSLGTGKYNTLTGSGGMGSETKVETINVDTGSHKGIKAGTKACTYSYNSVEEGSDNVAGQQYSDEASGGIIIAGGKIKVDTTGAGIKYNGGGGMFGGSSSGNLSAAYDGQVIIGAPDDGIKSQNIMKITGGETTVYASDDGISAVEELEITGNAVVKVEQAYEGVESGVITVGSEDKTAGEPTLTVYSNDDGINAAKKVNVTYVYEDESEEKYTKTTTASSGNKMTVLSGYVNVEIADDTTHSFSLKTKDGSTTTSTFSADGDGIDCNGSLYLMGGTTIVYGANSNGNAPLDIGEGNCTFQIGEGATVLATGASGMVITPSNGSQSYLTTSGSSGGFGGFGGRPGQNGGGNSSAVSISAGTPVAIMDSSDNLLVAYKSPKAGSYVLYSSPELTSNGSYKLCVGGTIDGDPVRADVARDYRYTSYNSSGATTQTLTAK
ncbi:MAG: carbohydrate-binding domain-containing protein [Eubacterium sp.]|nr:carbohydrate-binding domain-containing protein [Eubacterium sp.]